MATARTAKSAASNMQLPPEVLEGIYTTMRRIRRFDEYTHQLFEEGLVKGTAHSYVGQEAIAAAVGANLREDDFMASNHRGHGPVVSATKLDAAVYATEELEETAKLYLLLHAHNPRCLTPEQIEELERVFGKAGG